jgi:gliding motility-associated protein GldM
LVDGVKETWETENFYHLPLAAVITNLSKIQADVKNVEAECILQISSAPGKLAFTANKLAAKVISPSKYIQSGDKYTADVFLAASSDDFKNPDIISIFRNAKYDTVSKTCTGCDGNENLLPIDANGFGKFEAGTGGLGEQKWGGVIRYKNKKGQFEYYPFEETYNVSPPSVSVQADEMNVFYIGVDNPITVNAAGIPPTDLIVNSKGGGITMTRKGNTSSWIVKATTPCPKGQEAEIIVSGKPRPDGTKPKGGSMKFRVKRIPPPYPMLAGKKSGDKISKVDCSGASFLTAKLDNFDFNANFKVVSWEFAGVISGAPKSCTGSGGALSEECKGYLKKAGTGSRLYFDVKVQGPDGQVLTLPTLGLKVQ